jgi:hypothetical protein
MAKNTQPVKTVDQRLTSIETELTQINKKLGILTAPFERGERKPDKVIYDGVKTMPFKEAAMVPGRWEVRGKEWVKIAD